MSVPHICSTCRRTIVQIISGPTLRKYTTFVSLSSAPRTSVKEKQRDDHPSPANNAKSHTTNPRPVNPRTKPGDALEALFEEAFKKGPNEPSTSPDTRLIELEGHIETLSEMLREKLPLQNCWSFFLSHFGPSAWKAGTIDRATCPTHLKIIAPQLLGFIMEAKSAEPTSNNLPTYTELTLPFFELGMLTFRQWAKMMNALLVNIFEARGPLAARESQPLVMDLLMSWNIVCRKPTIEATANINPSSLDWSYVPQIPPLKLVQQRSRQQINGAFALLIPAVRSLRYTVRPFDMKMSGVALGTIKVLLDLEGHGLGGPLIPDTSALLKTLLNVVHICQIELGHLSSPEFEGVPQPIIQAIKNDWVAIMESASKVLPPIMAPNLPFSLPFAGTDSGRILKKLNQAFEARDRKQAEDLWVDAQRLPVAKLAIDNAQGGLQFMSGYLTPALYHRFIHTFMGLRLPAHAIEVWNHMVGNDIMPDVAAWDAMLNGCKDARDFKALNEVWSRMISSGIKPDVQCWTSRISGLISCKQIEDSIYALDEMGRLWLQAVRKKHPDIKGPKLQEVAAVPGAVKPTIATVNAAVSGLLTQRQTEAANRVLSWASKLGINPDVQTYNMLIRPLIREGRADKATALLKSMQAQEISPDTATFVTICEEVFRDAHKETPDQLKDTVKSVFGMMEQAGVEINLYAYNKIIYILLQANPNDISPITTVMDHMTSRNVQPNAYTYTMLVNHYFSLQPPDLEAVRILIERARLEVGAVDHVFWDRVIEGYARAGDTATALRILGRIQPSKQYTSWDTLRTLLMALIENNEWDTAKELVVNTTIDKGGPIGVNEKGVEGQHKFWELATELRLV